MQKVTFTKGRSVEHGHLPFDIRWTILLKDARKLEIELGAPPNLKGTWWTCREATKTRRR